MKDQPLAMVTNGKRITTEKTFPAINPVTEEVIAEVLEVDALSAYVYTTNLSRGLRAAAEIDAGSVCVNEVHYAVQLPYGGVRQSGAGKGCSRYSIEEYLTLKRVSVLM